MKKINQLHFDHSSGTVHTATFSSRPELSIGRTLLWVVLFLLTCQSAMAQTVIPYSTGVLGSNGLPGFDGGGFFDDDTGVYFIGVTDNASFTPTAGAYQPAFRGSLCPVYTSNAFTVMVNSDEALRFNGRRNRYLPNTPTTIGLAATGT